MDEVTSQVWIALITGVCSTATALVTLWITLHVKKVVDDPATGLVKVHDLVNSNLSIVKAELIQARTMITALANQLAVEGPKIEPQKPKGDG